MVRDRFNLSSPWALLPALLVAAPAGLVGQGFVHEQWTVANGLPVNAVNAVLQARSGYLWLGTFDGVVRFDGVQFTLFSSATSPGLAGNRILSLLEARDGTLWMQTEQGYLASLREGEFTQYGASRGIAGNHLLAIAEGPDGTLWIGTETGLRVLQDGVFRPIASQEIPYHVTSLLVEPDGSVWAGTTENGLFHWSGELLAHWPPGDGLPGGGLGALHRDVRGRMWAGGGSGFAVLGDNGRWTGHPAQVVTGIVSRPSDGSVWIATVDGVFVAGDGGVRPVRMEPAPPGVMGTRHTLAPALKLDPEGNVWYALDSSLYRNEELVHRLPIPPARAGFRPPPVNELAWDREGSLWIATHSSGLHRLRPGAFRVWSEEEGLAHRNVYPVMEDDSGAIWVGTWGNGLSRIEGDRVTSFPVASGFPGFVTALHQDRQGRILVGSIGFPTCEVRGSACIPLPGEEPSWDVGVPAIHQDRQGRLWISQGTGLRRQEVDGGWTDLSREEALAGALVRVILEAPDGTLWFGTSGGGVVRHDGTGFHRTGVAEGLSSDLVRSLHLDEDGVLWVGTEGQGLARLDPGGGLTTYRREHGLFDDGIHQILEDGSRRLWMSSNRGIFHVSRDELNAFARGAIAHVNSAAYTEREGLRNREANGGTSPAGTRGRDGRLWFPTQDGVAVIDPNTIRRNTLPPPVDIQQVLVGNRVIPVGAAPLTLGVDQRSFQVDYTALSLLAPENVRFRYRLEGYDRDWVEAGARRSAFYTRVPPGRYTFRVLASNNDGVWNEEGAAQTLVVEARFIETRAFSWLLLLSAVLAVYLLVRARTRAARFREAELTRLVDERTVELRANQSQLARQNDLLEQQARRLRELDEAKSRFFANISHEFRTPLTLVLGPLEDLRRGRGGTVDEAGAGQVEMALRNGRRLLDLIEQILELARLESGQMEVHPRRGDFTAWCSRLVESFRSAAEQKGIHLHHHHPEHPVHARFDPQLLETAVLNLLSNALKFTPSGGRVDVRTGLLAGDSGPRPFLEVTDDGPGIPPASLAHVFERFFRVDDAGPTRQPGTGIGLALARELAELHGGTLEVESEEGRGSTFTLVLPAVAEAEGGAEVPDPGPATGAMPGEVGLERIPSEAWRYPDASPSEPGEGEAEEADVTTILLVEDNAEIRALVRSQLSGRFRVLEAVEGEAGLRMARESLPDLVLSDIMMPGVDGLDLARRLRADPETDFIPVVLLTARAGTDSRIEGLEGGADAYIVKPFDRRELDATVDNLIATRRRLRDRYSTAAPTPTSLHARPVEVRSTDEAYLQRLRSVLEEHLSDETFGVGELARRMAQDRSSLYRKVRELLDETPTALLRRVRLERAAQLLAARAGSVSEVAYASGFNSVSHFSRVFREVHGVTPSRWRSEPPA
jgi:signal transduction histidine kinase/ligand-binding sensor domain-containing protein/DNA-binding response OmpR family regulator